MNKIFLSIAFVCLIISIIKAEDVKTKQDLDEIPGKETKEIPIAVESDPVKDDEQIDTNNKNENEDKSKDESDADDADDDEDDDELSSKELSTLDQILTILTNVVVGE